MKRSLFIILIIIFNITSIYSKTAIKNFTITTEFDQSSGIKTKMKLKWHNLSIGRIGISSSSNFKYNNKISLDTKLYRKVDLHAYYNIPNDLIMFDFTYQTNLGYYQNDFKDKQYLLAIRTGNWENVPLYFDTKIKLNGADDIGYKSQFQMKTYYEACRDGWKLIPSLSYGIMADELSQKALENYFKCEFEIQKTLKNNIKLFSNFGLNANFYRENSFATTNDISAKFGFGIKF